jgi:hypothetical protein
MATVLNTTDAAAHSRVAVASASSWDGTPCAAGRTVGRVEPMTLFLT